MKTYVINLAKNTERLVAMTRQLQAFKIPFERFNAILGAKLSPSEARASVNRVRSYCALMRWLAPGEIGCALSHLGVYRRMMEQKDSVALVMEDDVNLSNEFPERLTLAQSQIDVSKPQVILFSALVAGNETHSPGLQRLTGGYGADTYLITLPAAKAILKANYPVVIPADQWRTWTRRKQIELFRMWPITSRQNRANYGSEIGLNYRRAPLIRRLAHKAMRAIGLAIDECWYWGTGK